jgi:outer membrane receptor protein involved in Fe transport
VLNGYNNFDAVDISEAAFVNVDFGITERLKVNLGVRYEHSIVEHQSEISAGPVNGLTYASNVLPDEVANPITPKYGLSYQLTDQEMVYFTAAKGYRAGGGNSASVVGNSICNPSLATLGLSSAPATFTSDSLWSYELGTKGTFFDRRLNVEASAYLIHWSDIQTSVALPSCGQSFTTNRGKAVSQGFDLQVAALPVPGVKLALAVGYTDAYYPNASYGAPVDGVTPLLNAAGDKLVNVLPWTASAIAEYSHDIGFLWNDARSYLRLDYRWLDAGNTYNPEVAGYDPAMSPYQNPAYSMLNVRLGVLHKGLDVSAFINNSTHSNPALAYAHDLPGEALFYASSIRPFTAGLSAYYRW